jgi:hypothetical protein
MLSKDRLDLSSAKDVEEVCPKDVASILCCLHRLI